MKIVLDTNCFISCIGKKSVYRNVFDAFLDGKYTLCVSSEILMEYEEMFNKFWGNEVAQNLLGFILTAENTSFISIFYNFLLVEGDPDDNKFSDTYLSAIADILVTNDKKVLALNKSDFPPVRTMTLQEFSDYIKTST